MAKAFRFKLEKVLEYRRQLEERAMMVLAEERRQEGRLADALEGGRAARGAPAAGLPARTHPEPAAPRPFRSHRERLGPDFERATAALAAQTEVVAKAQAALVDRARERKLLDKLKTRQAALHAKAENIAEQKEYDEMSSLRFRHQDIAAL